jgi:hypothetical protein
MGGTKQAMTVGLESRRVYHSSDATEAHGQIPSADNGSMVSVLTVGLASALEPA